MQKMTINDLEAMADEVLTPSQVAPLLRMNPDTLRLAAREFPEQLGFPVIVIGSRVKIPRRAFIRFLSEGGERIDD